MNLYPQSMGMDGGEAGKLMMEDMGGTLLESSGGLLLLAKEGIRLESMTGISVQGVSDIMALYGAGTSSLCVNGSVDMMGALTGLGGSTYRNYAPYADAPEEGEFDWGGFARNLVMGLAVGAACIAMSLLLPGIGTIAAGALMGAGIGAVSASVAGAVGDYSSGNVRSTEEVIRDVAVSMVSGALTGAITGGLGAKLTSAFPKAAEAVGKIPLADWAKVGLFNTGDGILGRMVYAVADENMSVEEKFAYAFSPEHMAMDFLGGAAMYGMSKVLPKIREKLPWNKISNESGTGTKDIYRAVSPEEFDDIFATGGFRARPDGRSFQAKEFGNSFDETLEFANKPINLDKAAIVKVTIPENVYNQLHHMNLDRAIFKSGTPVVEPEMLDMFNESIISIEHAF